MKNIHIIFKNNLILSALILVSFHGFAQEEIIDEKPVARPERPAFESGLLFDQATTTLQPSKTLEMIIQHRFGTMDNGITDLYGLWAPSNIRLGLNYSIVDNLMVGVGATKFNKMQDVRLKYNLLQQTRSNSIPVTVSLHEVIGIDGSAESKFGKNYAFSNRFSFYTEVIVSHRFNNMFSLQLAPSFTHYNSMDSIYDHDRFAISFAGRVKFSPQSSLIVSGDFPLNIQGISEHTEKVNDANDILAKPNICIGLEVSTSTHAFHIYLGTSQGILPQENIMFNRNDFFDGNIILGLNITRLWNF
ncbi:MAG: DUF5777 family beta-barrel protein [Lentimicrobium sp.]|jgi:hypothetical protein|nr:DUF5777 family beta-barrel protein [Lentimicrobium sp.]